MHVSSLYVFAIDYQFCSFKQPFELITWDNIRQSSRLTGCPGSNFCLDKIIDAGHRVLWCVDLVACDLLPPKTAFSTVQTEDQTELSRLVGHRSVSENSAPFIH